eukprot:gene2715-3012_t
MDQQTAHGETAANSRELTTPSQEPITASQLEVILNPPSVPLLSQLVEPADGLPTDLFATQTQGSQSLQMQMEMALAEQLQGGVKRHLTGGDAASQLAKTAIVNNAMKECLKDAELKIQPLDLGLKLGMDSSMAGSMAKRRGPMDEMRQLQRILTKLLPASASYMPAGTDGGGNKVQADQIKIYLAATLGDAPKPDWGLKLGWGQYLADLFNWATGQTTINKYQAMECARRQQGRSWEVLYDKLMELGVYSWNWGIPLKREQAVQFKQGQGVELLQLPETTVINTIQLVNAAYAQFATSIKDYMFSCMIQQRKAADGAVLLLGHPHSEAARAAAGGCHGVDAGGGGNTSMLAGGPSLGAATTFALLAGEGAGAFDSFYNGNIRGDIAASWEDNSDWQSPVPEIQYYAPAVTFVPDAQCIFLMSPAGKIVQFVQGPLVVEADKHYSLSLQIWATSSESGYPVAVSLGLRQYAANYRYYGESTTFLDVSSLPFTFVQLTVPVAVVPPTASGPELQTFFILRIFTNSTVCVTNATLDEVSNVPVPVPSLTNPSFEYGYRATDPAYTTITGNTAETWADNSAWQSPIPTMNYYLSTIDYKEGNQSQCVTLSPSSGRWVQFGQELDALPTARNYSMSLWAITHTAPVRVQLRLQLSPAPYTLYGVTEVTLTNSDIWVMLELPWVEVPATAGDGGITSALFQFLVLDPADVCIDAATFQEAIYGNANGKVKVTCPGVVTDNLSGLIISLTVNVTQGNSLPGSASSSATVSLAGTVSSADCSGSLGGVGTITSTCPRGPTGQRMTVVIENPAGTNASMIKTGTFASSDSSSPFCPSGGLSGNRRFIKKKAVKKKNRGG